MKKRLLVTAIMVSTLLSACASDQGELLYNNSKQIASETDSFSYLNPFEQHVGDYAYQASIDGMNGMDTVWTYNADADVEVEINYNVAVEKGEMKIVLISPEKKLSTICECSEEDSLDGIQTFALKKGENRIKIVARDEAVFDVSLSSDKGVFHSLSF